MGSVRFWSPIPGGDLDYIWTWDRKSLSTERIGEGEEKERKASKTNGTAFLIWRKSTV